MHFAFKQEIVSGRPDILPYVCSWRSKLTKLLQNQYCKKHHFYWISGLCDNPDQRIASDTNIFCNCLGSIAKVIAAAPFQVTMSVN